MRGCLCCRVISRQIRSTTFLPLGDDRRDFSYQCSTRQPPNMCFTVLIGARHTSPRALYSKGESEPLTSSPRSDFTTRSLSSSNEVCGAHEITPRLIQDLLDIFSSRCWPKSPPEILFSRKIGKFQKQIIQNWTHRHPSRQLFAGIFGNLTLK